MKKKYRLLVIVPLLLTTSCTDQMSDNPVNPPSGTAVNPSSFLGQWRLTSIGTYSPTNQSILNVTTSQVGTVVATFSSSAASNDHTVILCVTNGVTLASVQFGANSWQIYSVSTNPQGTTLTLGGPDPAVLSNDVKNGVLNGTVLESGEGDCSIHLMATSSQLLTYFSTRTDIFGPAMTFQKQ